MPPAANQTANIAPSATISDKSKIKTFDGTGAVTKINLEIGSVELDHEEIKGLMPAMLMEFYVSDKKMLDKLKVGDKVNFVLEDNAGVEQIISIKKK
ncbi:MAG: copper-binding protein [Pyrinomonadaceae bacterium]|nr:copper-binding protein [Pyrinomonadaceae bacterium]